MKSKLDRELDQLNEEINGLRRHGPSRFVSEDATEEAAKAVAARGPQWGTKGAVQPGRYAGPQAAGLARFIKDVADHRTEGMTPAYQAKALAESTDSAGGFLLVPEIASSVMMLIRNRTAVLKMPVTNVTPESKQYVLPGLASGATATWLTENASIPASAEAFQVQATLQPRPLASLVAISNRLLADAVAGNPSAAGSAESVIQQDLADLMAVTLDAGLLIGNSSGPAPKGITLTSGTTALPGGTIATNGSSLSYSILVAIVSALQQANMPFSSPGWIFSGRTLQSLMTLTNSIGEPLLASAGLLNLDSSGSGGTLLGYPFLTSNALSNAQTYGTASNASTIIFSGDWSELWVGQWQQLAIDSSSEASYSPDGTNWVSAYQSMQTVVRASLWADMAIRRPAAFVVANGILP